MSTKHNMAAEENCRLSAGSKVPTPGAQPEPCGARTQAPLLPQASRDTRHFCDAGNHQAGTQAPASLSLTIHATFCSRYGQDTPLRFPQDAMVPQTSKCPLFLLSQPLIQDNASRMRQMVNFGQSWQLQRTSVGGSFKKGDLCAGVSSDWTRKQVQGSSPVDVSVPSQCLKCRQSKGANAGKPLRNVPALVLPVLVSLSWGGEPGCPSESAADWRKEIGLLYRRETPERVYLALLGR